MRSFLYLVLIFLMFFNCSKNVEVPSDVMPPLTDVLTLELTFGDEKTIEKNEFLIADPRMTIVSYNGDILIADEGRIKVFDENGKEKKIFGRVGQGPGEFYRSYAPYLGPEGYLIVVDASGYVSALEFFKSYSGLSNYYNLFAPDYTFIDKKRFENSLLMEEYLKTKNLNIEYVHSIAKIIAINTDEKVYEIALKNKKIIAINTLEDLLRADAMRNQPTKPDTNYAVILYENADTVVPLLKTRMINPPSSMSSSYPLGELHWELLSDRRVIYVDANEDTYNEQAGSFYTIHLVSMDSIEDKRIIHLFTPVEFPESMINPQKVKGALDHKKPEVFKKMEESKVQAYRDKKYYPSIERMKIDGNYAFMFTYVENDEEEILTDIFDLEAETYIKSVYFPFIPADIKNGYAYKRGKSEEGFYVIEKYKIDPVVYVK